MLVAICTLRGVYSCAKSDTKMTPMKPMPRGVSGVGSKRGFSLVELLVVITMLAGLISLFLPAVQASREAARKATCASHLRQIGLALNSYHGAQAAFPTGCVDWRPWGNTSNRQVAWSALILPFLEEQHVYDLLDLNKAFDDIANALAAATPIAVFRCPSSLHVEPTVEGRGRSDFGGIYGERINSPNRPPKGIMLLDQAVSLKQITDGASRTIIVGEDTFWPEGQWINGRNIFDQGFPINAVAGFENDISSDHPGGAQVLYAGGAVQFLVEETEQRLLGSICTRSRGEVISAF